MAKIDPKWEAVLFNNFYIATKGIFTCCKRPSRRADYTSKSGSKYWYGKDKGGFYVIRHSTHWTRILSPKKNQISIECGYINTCRWTLMGSDSRSNTGKIYLSDFK
jgi:hypothetical protein